MLVVVLLLIAALAAGVVAVAMHGGVTKALERVVHMEAGDVDQWAAELQVASRPDEAFALYTFQERPHARAAERQRS